MEAKEFGLYLRELRKAREFTLKQLADESHVSQSYITNVENNKRGIPSPDVLKKLADPLGVSYEELMIKAGYWRKININNESYINDFYQLELKNKIVLYIKEIADDDGIFPDYLHDEIFNIFGGWLTLSEDNQPSHMFDKFYKYDYLTIPDKEDYFGKDYLKEIHERFNNIYNYTAIKIAINSYSGDKDLFVFFSELIQLMNKYELTMDVNEDEQFPKTPLPIELTEILDTSSLNSVLYKGKPLEKDDRLRILGMLSVLFP